MDSQFLTLLFAIYAILAAVRYDVIVRAWDALADGVRTLVRLRIRRKK